MTYPLVLDLAADGIPVSVTCRVLGFSTQGFYKWRVNPVSRRDWDDAHLINAIIDIHADDPEFGSRFITDELHAAGQVASENRIQRLCALQQVDSSIIKKRRGSGKDPWPGGPRRPRQPDLPRRPARPDLADRHLRAPHRRGQALHLRGQGRLLERIVGYAIGPRMTSHLADAALRTAIARRAPTGTLVVHSDRGGQFRSKRFQRTCAPTA
jgi:putative transposase